MDKCCLTGRLFISFLKYPSLSDHTDACMVKTSKPALIYAANLLKLKKAFLSVPLKICLITFWYHQLTKRCRIKPSIYTLQSYIKTGVSHIETSEVRRLFHDRSYSRPLKKTKWEPTLGITLKHCCFTNLSVTPTNHRKELMDYWVGTRDCWVRVSLVPQNFSTVLSR